MHPHPFRDPKHGGDKSDPAPIIHLLFTDLLVSVDSSIWPHMAAAQRIRRSKRIISVAPLPYLSCYPHLFLGGDEKKEA